MATKSEQATASQTPTSRIPALDGVRGAAILLVLILHFSGAASASIGIFPVYFAMLVFLLFVLPWVIPGEEAASAKLRENQLWLGLYYGDIEVRAFGNEAQLAEAGLERSNNDSIILLASR